MRLTINLDDDLYAMARAHAIASKISISKAVGDLLRRRSPHHSPGSPIEKGVHISVHPLSGFPLAAAGNVAFGSDDVRKAEEAEDLRCWSDASESASPKVP